MLQGPTRLGRLWENAPEKEGRKEGGKKRQREGGSLRGKGEKEEGRERRKGGIMNINDTVDS